MADDEEVTERLAVELVRQRAQGCCGDDSWRGRFCQYHEGYLDGLEARLDLLVAAMAAIQRGR